MDEHSYIEIRGEDMAREEEIEQLFPDYLRFLCKKVKIYTKEVQEIRIRVNKPVMVFMKNKECFITKDGEITYRQELAYKIEKTEIEDILNHICNHSMYAFEEEIKQGFLTVKGGHRIGLAGEIILENNAIKNMKYITFMNIRISHEIKNVADKVMSFLYEDSNFLNGMIISPPGCGKTTLLRDIIRQASNGNKYGRGVTVGVVDERSEIGGCFMGIPQNDIGLRTDLLDNCPKVEGMMLLIRGMAPRIIAVDELGSKEDINALETILQCGCKVIATVHGTSIEDVKGKPYLNQVIQSKIFDRYIVLNQIGNVGNIEGIYDKDGHRL